MPSTSSRLLVALPPQSVNDLVLFGMNSVRPTGEVQELVYCPASHHAAGSTVECAYVKLEQVEHINALMLSKQVSCWGAEMGANEHGVCIGYTSSGSSAFIEQGLTGRDLVRLGLERATNAESAADIIKELVVVYGLNGQHDVFPFVSISMLICDRSEAWILEAVGRHTAVVRVKSGVKLLCGELTIRTEFDKSSVDLREFAVQHQRWSAADGEFDFARAFTCNPGDLDSSKVDSTLQQIINAGDLSPRSMLDVLRHNDHSSTVDGFSVAGSQLSLLPRSGTTGDSSAPSFLPLCVHWFTATPRPELSFFKPFVFDDGDRAASVCDRTTAPCRNAESEHALWIAHRRFTSRLDAGDKRSESVLANVRELEQQCFADVDELIRGEESGGKSDHVSSLFEHMVDLEINFYN